FRINAATAQTGSSSPLRLRGAPKRRFGTTAAGRRQRWSWGNASQLTRRGFRLLTSAATEARALDRSIARAPRVRRLLGAQVGGSVARGGAAARSQRHRDVSSVDSPKPRGEQAARPIRARTH